MTKSPPDTGASSKTMRSRPAYVNGEFQGTAPLHAEPEAFSHFKMNELAGKYQGFLPGGEATLRPAFLS